MSDCIQLRRFLTVNKSIQYLNLSNCNIDRHTGHSLAEGLRDNNCIKELDISNNYCSDHVMYIIIMALRNNSQLRYLNISRSGCESKAVEGFSELIKISQNLVYVDFTYNYFTDNDLMMMSISLVQN